MKQIQLRPMTIGDILDSAIHLYKENLLKFLGIVILPQIPFLLIAAFIMPLAFKFDPRTGATVSQVVAGVIAISILPFAVAAGTRAISESFLGREITIAQAYNYMLKRLTPLLWTTFLFTVFLVAASFPALVLSVIMILSLINIGIEVTIFIPVIIFVVIVGMLIPSVFLVVRYSLITQAVIIEGESGTGALKRSQELIKDHFWRAFALIALLYIATLIFDITIGLSLSLASSLFSSAPIFSIVLSMMSAPGLSIIETFIMISMTLFYYDLRIRKEGFDLEIMAEELASENI